MTMHELKKWLLKNKGCNFNVTKYTKFELETLLTIINNFKGEYEK